MYVHSQSPCRIGIAGGGTDLPAWTKERTGYCLSLAINVHAHAVAITRQDRQVVASYRSRDSASAATEIANGLIRESALMHGWLDGFEVHTLSEVTSFGSGLGVSSSFAVCLAAAFARMSRLAKGDESPEETPIAAIARGAWIVEIDHLRRPIGRQDHMAAAWGSLRLYAFEGIKASVEQTFSEDEANWVANNIILVRLPEGHDSRAILSGAKRADQLQAAFDAVEIAKNAILEKNAPLLGHAFDIGQTSKKKVPGAVPDWISEIILKIECCEGVHGVKIAGAGGGGHLVVACEPSAVEAIEFETGLETMKVKPDFRGVRSEGWL